MNQKCSKVFDPNLTNTYDQDGTILIEADGTGSEWELPGNYHLTYGCYSQEMVDKLDEIVNKYHLKLLSSYIPLNYYESSVLLNSLGLKGLVKTDPDVQVEYWDGDFHIEGTFTLNMESVLIWVIGVGSKVLPAIATL